MKDQDCINALQGNQNLPVSWQWSKRSCAVHMTLPKVKFHSNIEELVDAFFDTNSTDESTKNMIFEADPVRPMQTPRSIVV